MDIMSPLLLLLTDNYSSTDSSPAIQFVAFQAPSRLLNSHRSHLKLVYGLSIVACIYAFDFFVNVSHYLFWLAYPTFFPFNVYQWLPKNTNGFNFWNLLLSQIVLEHMIITKNQFAIAYWEILSYISKN